MNMKRWIATGLVLMIFGIILGAFGAHSVKTLVSDEKLLVAFETAVRYQLIHALAFLIIPFILKYFQLISKTAYWLLLIGVILFSGSIYLLVVRDIEAAEWLRFAGPVTPIGGLLLIAGWIVLLVKVVRKKA